MPKLADLVKKSLVPGVQKILDGGTVDAGKVGSGVDQLAAEVADNFADEIRRRAEAERNDLLLSELRSADAFTRRARPMVVYAGLVFIFFIHVLLPVIAFLKGSAAPSTGLPEEFWWAWSGVVSTWVLGRSYEKVHAPTALSKAITGGN